MKLHGTKITTCYGHTEEIIHALAGKIKYVEINYVDNERLQINFIEPCIVHGAMDLLSKFNNMEEQIEHTGLPLIQKVVVLKVILESFSAFRSA